MSELLPCPMCGGKAAASSYVIEAVVKCSGCQLKIVRSHGARDENGYPEAIAAWNHRHSGGDGEAWHAYVAEFVGEAAMRELRNRFEAARVGERG